MLIDCDSCAARGVRCADCVITVMLADTGDVPPPAGGDRRHGPVPAGGMPGRAAPAVSGGWDEQERRALRLLGAAGLLPPLEELAGSILERGSRHAPPPRRAG
ncbi:hypothetical protein [Candidatus Frankia nodulisporulans]|uniref:hypothetical protein n=1 Tax=Candidatus Frankia nodulisporulans TaxID=2060052 RepID=UPI0013D37E63|nr:hypothetical protein [Candidatus Frankia nodulisporulans]